MLLLFLVLFLTAQAFFSDPPRGEVRAVILSDINGAYGSTDYIPGIKRVIDAIVHVWQPDIVLFAGDLIAGQKADLPDNRFEEMWQAFDHHIAQPLRQAGIPFGFTLGNHDASSIRRADGTFVFAREREAAARYWKTHPPDLELLDDDDFPFHYTFLFKDIFVLVWDASSAYIPEAKLAWTREALWSPEAQSARLRLVLGHLPLYGVAEGRNLPGEVLDDGENLREMLEEYGAYVYISGHHHAYYPAKRGKLYLLNTGGVGPRRLLGSNAPPRTTVTIMDIALDGSEARYTTFDIATGERVELHDLPKRIDGLGGSITRINLAD